MKVRFILVVSLMALVVFSAPAFAQDDDGPTEDDWDQGLNVQLFRPSIFGGNFIALDDSDTLGVLGFHIGALVNYTNSLLTDYEDNEPNFDYIAQLYTADLMLAFGTFDFLSLGVNVPIHYVLRPDVEERQDYATLTADEFDEVTDEENMKWEAELGDIMAQLKIGLTKKDKHWIGIGLLPFVTFPTGNIESYLGEGRYTAGGTLVLEHDFDVFNFVLNGGYKYRDVSWVLGTDVGNSFLWGAGISKAFDNGLQFSIEYSGEYFDVDDTELVRPMPMEIIATLRYQFGENLPRLIVGAGPGLSTGVGAPAYRVLGGLDWTYKRGEMGTLVVKTVDEQGNPVAAKLHFTDEDGLTSDYDTAGTWEGEREPGRYTLAGSADGYLGATAEANVESDETAQVTLVLKKVTHVEACINVVDSVSGELVASTLTVAGAGLDNPTGKYCGMFLVGEQEITVSAPGYETQTAKIKVVAGQSNLFKIDLVRTSSFSFVITDGCTGEPVAANVVIDQGAANEVKAAAPNGKVVVTVAAGTHQVNVAAEGYQPYSAKIEAVKAQEVKVELKMIKKIVKQQEIRFATGSSRILPVSYPVLNNVADQIKKSCQAKKVIIEGHTDNQGSDAMNLKLSQARAEAVRKYLISQGISAALLEVQAYGESRPVADNATAEGREKNRRVEFIIVE